MISEKGDVKKICSFYVNDVHLVTMLLPYINRKLEEGSRIIAFPQESLQKSIDLLISKLNLKEEMKNKITTISWVDKKVYKYKEIEKYLCKTIAKGKTNIIIVSGKKEYIEIANRNILKWNKVHKEAIDVINCFEVMQFNDNIKEILDSHDKILNTSGEKDIAEVFEGYQKVV